MFASLTSCPDTFPLHSVYACRLYSLKDHNFISKPTHNGTSGVMPNYQCGVITMSVLNVE
uniref:Uncharacterized protein n=1 Tax=Arundo donax TaxID=35708 RepID=A0A0A9ECZ4_ARUDO